VQAKIKALVDDYDRFIGIDHHKRTSYLTVKDREGNTLKRGNIPTSKKALSLFLDDGENENGSASIAVFEAGRCYRPMYRWLSEMVETVVLAHPGGLKIVSDTVYKDDKLVLMVQMQTKVKNRIHSTIDLYPDALPTRPEVSDIFGKLGMHWLQ